MTETNVSGDLFRLRSLLTGLAWQVVYHSAVAVDDEDVVIRPDEAGILMLTDGVIDRITTAARFVFKGKRVTLYVDGET